MKEMGKVDFTPNLIKFSQSLSNAAFFNKNNDSGDNYESEPLTEVSIQVTCPDEMSL